MGTAESTPRSAPPTTPAIPKSAEVINRMQQKVLLSHEFLYKQHSHYTSQGRRNVSRRPPQTGADLYHLYFTTRKSTADTNLRENAADVTQSKASVSSLPVRRSGREGARVGRMAARRKSDKRKPAVGKEKCKGSRSATRPVKAKVQHQQIDSDEINLNDVMGGEEEGPHAVPHAKQYSNPFKQREQNACSEITQMSHLGLPQFDRVSLLPTEVFMTILSYAIDNFRNVMLVNPAWYHAATSALDLHFNTIETSFINAYSAQLLFKDSYTFSNLMRFCGKQTVKIERVFKCENQQAAGKTVILAFKYKYFNEPGNEYRCDYVFDSGRRGRSVVWLHKSEGEARASVQPIVTVCQGDNVELVFPLYSLRGLVDLKSVVWMPPLVQNAPKENVLNYKREQRIMTVRDRSEKLVADLGRISDLEDSQFEWRAIKDLAATLKSLSLELVLKHFDVVKAEYSHVDIYAAKLVLRARTQGKMPAIMLGIAVVIKEEWEECTREVKRAGLLFERHTALELRVGDMLIAYISRQQMK